MRPRLLLLVSIAVLAGCAAQAPPGQVHAQLVEIRPGKPPMQLYYLNLQCRNPRDRSVWLLLPDSLDKPIDLTDDRHHLESARFAGDESTQAPFVTVVTDVGHYRAIHLPPHASITLRGFEMDAWKPDVKSFDVLVADSILVNGRIPIENWLPYDTSTSPRADIAGARASSKLLDWDAKISDFRKDLPPEPKTIRVTNPTPITVTITPP